MAPEATEAAVLNSRCGAKLSYIQQAFWNTSVGRDHIPVTHGLPVSGKLFMLNPKLRT